MAAVGSGGGKSNLLAWLGLAAGAAEGVGGVLSRRADRQSQEKLTAQEIAARAALNRENIAAAESMADPFRHQLSQGRAINSLDRMERASYTPVRATPTGPYAKYVPQVSGGFSYEKSPELMASAGALKRDVMSGRTAPTMTNPMNYGRTATLSLDPSGAPGPAPRPDAAATRPLSDFIASYDRRGGGSGGGAVRGAAGGALSGASVGSIVPGVGTAVGAGVGALVGGLKGLFSRKAKTAGSDFAVEDARTAIDQAISYYQGRRATPQEVEQYLRRQGWEPGDRWVGEGGLLSVLSLIADAGQT